MYMCPIVMSCLRLFIVVIHCSFHDCFCVIIDTLNVIISVSYIELN